ncbi:GNAT family N-acetyltransferase [Clostridium sp. D2Q-11]|uniref:GNAT family N-acetyltransferase n=1 Tax=Anaeromonas frigoriresistens TaxID=2683708 RepID=A0A942USM2_9FIRM|nr:GNAT family N-acetyltransferase [Anaeromonas frigoriresistens]MBS4538469.1 GNAT family N-acetyltransferase [Anaeromonas frigoriresistens]
MSYIFKPMRIQEAEEIVNWHYAGDYSFYDMKSDKEDLDEFLEPSNWEDTYFTVYKDKELIGFFSFNRMVDETVEIGLGIKPSLTGKGLGYEFIISGLEFAKNRYNTDKFSLAVATFNQRAIKAYKKIGFEPNGTFIQKTNGGEYEFLRMKRES